PLSRSPLVGMEETTRQRLEIPQEVAAIRAERMDLEPPTCAHRPSPERTGPHGASLLPLTGPWRRRASRSGEERLLHHSPPVSHGAGFEALRLHAVLAIRWRA